MHSCLVDEAAWSATGKSAARKVLGELLMTGICMHYPLHMHEQMCSAPVVSSCAVWLYVCLGNLVHQVRLCVGTEACF